MESLLLFQRCTAVFVTKIIRNLRNTNHQCCTATGCIWPPATFLVYVALLLQCHQTAVPVAGFTPRWAQLFNLCNAVCFSIISWGSSYISATVAILFPTYSNTCSDRYVFKLLTWICDSAVWSVYSNVLNMVLNSGIAKIAVTIIGDRQSVVSGPIC
jgi:hypothetical protein